MPVHDVAGFVGPCLESLKAQTFTDWEAIVIDDGATDSSRAEAVGVMAGDPRFRLFAGPNGGLSAARNLGLALARGEVIGFLDGDDRWMPDFLSTLLTAMEEHGTDWAASGLRYVPVGGKGGSVHSAIHDAPVPDLAGGPRRVDLTDWREVVRHFPSAWNKLYRRRLIEGLSFDPGTYYEDHAFFWQVAARTRSLAHVPQPLCLQTVGRPGQITRDGGERVFQQFDVLDRLEAMVPALADRGDALAAFRNLAVRLIFERGLVITDAARLHRFVTRARDWLDDHGIDWQAERLPGARLDRFTRAMLCRRLLSVVVPTDGQTDPLWSTLDSLAWQGPPDLEVLVVPDGQHPPRTVATALSWDPRVSILGWDGRGEPAAETAAQRLARARNRGLAAAQGDFIVFLDAGDRMLPGTLDAWVDAMIASGGDDGADVGISGFRIGWDGGALHQGLHDAAPWPEPPADPDPDAPVLPPPAGPLTLDQALTLHALPSARIFRREFLQGAGLAFAPHDLQGWQMMLAAGLTARHALRLPGAGVVQGEAKGTRSFWTSAPAAQDLLAALDEVSAAIPGQSMTDAARLRLLTRAIWEKSGFAAFPDAAARDRFRDDMRTAWTALWTRIEATGGPLQDPFDPYVEPAFRAALMPADAARRLANARRPQALQGTSPPTEDMARDQRPEDTAARR